MLAEMGEHQLTIRNYLRHSNLTHEQVPAGDIKDQALGRTSWSTLFYLRVSCRRPISSKERRLRPFSGGKILVRRLSSL